MATGRVLVVHESAATRSLLADLLTREGLAVEAVETPYEAMARFVDEPADVVVLGLAGLSERELEIIPALRREAPPPRVLVTFPTPFRDAAVSALALGATGYALEPFYSGEIVGLVKGQLGAPGPARHAGDGAEPPAAAPDASAHVARLAHEVAHTINNPLQIITLLLEKDRVTKRELMSGLPGNVARIEQIVRMLREFGETPAGEPDALDPRPLIEHAAEDADVELDVDGSIPRARLHPENFAAALEGLFDALRTRAGGEARLGATLEAAGNGVTLRVAVERALFRGEKIGDLLDLPFVVREDREVYPSLARARMLLESMGGSLAAEQHGDRIAFVVRLSRA